ncbi:MAG: primosomal protein N' [Candidatus Marinimicrobia bacterium]|nr:primosomal protein N' [Candidatus Neomarinimicrobiota bacterium]MCF7827859.1 primosomal protein N' [Candidatus Neomarinimicrobiota bacterium]MCF7879386.1 primosomal protein N' [Candidatus Neomarinimicrobiota bacterium]
MSNETIVNIAFPIGTHQTFSYLVPDQYSRQIEIGSRVIAPLGRRKSQGYIVEIDPEIGENIRKKLKPIIKIIDDEPLFTEELVKLLKWISTYYLTPFGKVLHTALPSEIQVRKSVTYKRLISDEKLESNGDFPGLLNIPREQDVRESTFLEQTDLTQGELRTLLEEEYIVREIQYQPPAGRKVQTVKLERTVRDNFDAFLDDLDGRAVAQKRLLKELRNHTDWLPAAQAVQLADTGYSSLRSLEEKSLVQVQEKPVVQDPLQVYGEPIKKEVKYTTDQQAAIDAVLEGVGSEEFHPYLLYGVTGSGKTEIYLRAADEVLEKGQQVIMLVPEIALTPQTARRFRGHFGERVTLWHSNMSAGERAYTWRKIAAGDYGVIVGARSAIFAPVKNLGLIIIDEEQENSYKQSDPDPRYHARDAAMVRARNNDAVVILGTATPSLESYFNAVQNKYTMLELPERHTDAVPPSIRLVDMKKEREETAEYPYFLSVDLVEGIEARLKREEQIILLQNRRGFAPILQCMDCGWHAECPKCDISMTYHKTGNYLLCHYCDAEMAPLIQCPDCMGDKLQYTGMGTQRAEELLDERFPDARIVRMDADSTTQSGSHRKILDAFDQHEYDILLGTQMIAKGLDFPNVTLVGVLNADTGLFFPDFRAQERTFQLLAQVSGRSGRAEKPGEVIIQTSAIDDYAIKCATQNEFGQFYNRTLSDRNELDYPPFSRLANITVRGPRRDRVEELAAKIGHNLFSGKGKMQVLGPAPAPMERIRGNYHWRLTIKSRKEEDPTGSKLRQLLRTALLPMKEYPSSGNYRINLDIDPGDML